MRLMRTLTTGVAMAALVFLATQVATAQQKKSPERKPNPALAPIKDIPSLPRVLLIGDSISIGYTIPVRELLSGKANVHRPQANCGHTTKGLDSLTEWLGEGRWDVIHFNWGLHDLKYVDGKQPVPLAQYEKNLAELVARLKKTEAKLIWCSTTPVPEGCTPPRDNKDVLAYNEVARKIMIAQKVEIDDLYAYALPRLGKIQMPQNVHFGTEGSNSLAQQVASSVRKALGK